MSAQVLVNGRFLGRPVTGVERYARQLLAATAELAPGRFELIAPRSAERAPPVPGVPVHIAGRGEGYIWEQVELPYLSRGRPLLNLCNLAPIARRNQATVLHDAAPFAIPEAFSPAFRVYYRAMLPLVARRSRPLFTVSSFSRDELSHHLRLPKNRFNVIPAAVDQIRNVEPDQRILERVVDGGRPFVLTVGSLDPRKNLAAILEAARHLPDLRFVVAGGGNHAVFAQRGLRPPPNVTFLGYVSDGQLKALYEEAAAFAFPSRYEGFGLPPLEAMACGCPVVASRAASLPEICGSAATYCDPDDTAALATALRRFVNDPAARAEARREGPARSEAFSWRRSAERLLFALEEAFGA